MNFTLTAADLLRNALPGGVFLTCAYLIHGSFAAPFNLEGGFLKASLLTALAVLIGTTIQAVHRALFYFLAVKHMVYDRSRHEHFWEVSNFDLTYRKLKTELQTKEDNRKEVDWLNSWGDKTHFLWASAYAVILAIWAPLLIVDLRPSYVYLGFAMFAAFLYFLAWLDDVRYAQHWHDALKLEPFLPINRSQWLTLIAALGSIVIAGLEASLYHAVSGFTWWVILVVWLALALLMLFAFDNRRRRPQASHGGIP